MHFIIAIIIAIIIVNIIKWIVGTKCFVTARLNITGYFSGESEFFEYICSNRLEYNRLIQYLSQRC